MKTEDVQDLRDKIKEALKNTPFGWQEAAFLGRVFDMLFHKLDDGPKTEEIPKILGMNITLDEDIPEGEFRMIDHNGRVVAKVINITK